MRIAPVANKRCNLDLKIHIQFQTWRSVVNGLLKHRALISSVCRSFYSTSRYARALVPCKARLLSLLGHYCPQSSRLHWLVHHSNERPFGTLIDFAIDRNSTGGSWIYFSCQRPCAFWMLIFRPFPEYPRSHWFMKLPPTQYNMPPGNTYLYLGMWKMRSVSHSGLLSAQLSSLRLSRCLQFGSIQASGFYW